MKKQTKLILITLIVTGSSQKLFQQSSINGLVAGHAAAAGPVSSFWCGWDNLTTVPFNIEHRGTQDINFLTGGTQRMTIKGTGSANPGFVGMGTPSFPPLFQLDVNDNANLNINYNTTGAGFGYRINGDKLLSNPGISNTFVGKNAGAAWVFPGPGLFQQCTFVGEDAGPVSTGEGCTFVGTQSGLNNTAGTFNTFLGSFSGQNNTLGRFNTFLGHHAGLNNTTGNNNTFVGYHAVGGTNVCTGDNNTAVGIAVNGDLTSGSDNCMFGRTSGRSTTSGSGNSFYGVNSGFGNITGNNNLFMGTAAGTVNRSGSDNVILGAQANMVAGQFTLTNAVAIGFQAIVSANNKMILGNNNINVGIGLSNLAAGSGPAKKLEINETGVASAIASNTSIPGTFGGSGLRFTKLTSATPTTASTGKVLTVNANGDVILVADQTSSVAPGSVFAQNGLSLVGTNTVELGGTLLHNTSIDLASFDISYFNTPASQHYQRGANGGVWQFAIGVNNKDNQANFSDNAYATSTGGIVVGRQLQVTPTSPGVATSELRGDQVLVVGTSTAGGGISGSVTGINVITNNLTSPSGNNVSIAAWAQGASSSSAGAINVGLKTLISGTNSQRNYGVYSIIQGAPAANEDIGVNVFSMSNTSSTTNIGGNFNVSNGQNVYGLKATAQGGNATNYGIYAKATPNGTLNIAVYGESGINTVSPTPGPGTFAGYFNGDVVRTGGDNFTSDLNLKQNIDTIPNALGTINKLQPIKFDYKISSYPSMRLQSGIQYGVGAQPTQTVLPAIVNTITHPAQLDSLGNVSVPSFTYLSVEYQQLTPILIRAVQQLSSQNKKQDSTIQAMQSQIAALTSSVTSCCSSTAVRTTKPNELNQLDVNLSDKDIVVLNQNVPNPFAEQTTITYNVPDKYNFAQIIFSTVEGKIIKTVDITKKGKGQLNVFANDLGTGFYTYTLVVDGKTIDTKKMMKSE